ncbi:MAG: hypothetical protein ACOCVA_02365 [Prolixibacteraceae bacterium]
MFNKKLTRKAAIQKAGITALTAASVSFIATKASAQSSNSNSKRPSTPPGAQDNERPNRP